MRIVDRWLPPVALILAFVGFFGPWIPHKTVALTVTGFELAEFAKFFPEVQTGTVPLARHLFVTPLVAVALLLGIWANARSERLAVRIIWTGLAFLLALVALPPYESLRALDYASQLRLALGGALLVLLTPLTRRLGPRARHILVALIALGGALGALSQFLRLRPLVEALYNQPLGVGWGLVTCMIGFGLIAAWAVFASVALDRPDRDRRAASQTNGALAPQDRGNTQMDESKGIVVYATDWCPDCSLAKRVLDQQGIAYEWIDVDKDPAASVYVKQVNRGFRSVPTIVFPDGSTLTEPSKRELTQKLSSLG